MPRCHGHLLSATSSSTADSSEVSGDVGKSRRELFLDLLVKLNFWRASLLVLPRDTSDSNAFHQASLDTLKQGLAYYVSPELQREYAREPLAEELLLEFVYPALRRVRRDSRCKDKASRGRRAGPAPAPAQALSISYQPPLRPRQSKI